MKTKGHLEIAGAGLAGIAAATAFGQAGWSVRVHEKGSELREIGAGIYLWENGLKSLEALNVFGAVTRRAERVRTPYLRDHKGRVLLVDQLEERRLFTVPRQHLYQCLLDAAVAAGVEFHTNSTVVGASPSGALKLENGKYLEADLVIGADGVFSSVRDDLGLRRELRDLRDGGGRHLIARTTDDPVEETIEQWNGGRRVGIVPCSPELTYLFLCCPANDTAGRLQQPFTPDAWLYSFPQFESQLKRIPRNTEGRWAPFHDVYTHGWHVGKAAIIGDAAHGMSPNLGQAACVALTNAVAIRDSVVGGETVEEALDRWEQQERPVGAKVQQYSRVYGEIGTKWPRPMQGVRSSLVRGLIQSNIVQSRINFGANYFPAGANR